VVKDKDPVSAGLFLEVFSDLSVVLAFDDFVVLELLPSHRSRSFPPLESSEIKGGELFTTAKIFNDCMLFLLGKVPLVAFRASEDLVGGLAVVGRENGIVESGRRELMGSGGDHIEFNEADEARVGRVL